MKPYLVSAPWTHEDEAIAFRDGRAIPAMNLRATSLQLDIRDALLMRWLATANDAHYNIEPRLPPEAWLPIVHLLIRIDPEWPLGHYGVLCYLKSRP